MEAKLIAQAAVNIVQEIEDFSPEDRLKVLNAVRVMIGGNKDLVESGIEFSDGNDPNGPEFSADAMRWMKQSKLEPAQLNEVFDFTGGNVQIISPALPGANNKAKTLNAYILLGISKLLLSGEAKFSDKEARDLCRRFACYDEGNHSAYMRGRGSYIGGGKEAGWHLTVPGLTEGGNLVKSLLGK